MKEKEMTGEEEVKTEAEEKIEAEEQDRTSDPETSENTEQELDEPVEVNSTEDEENTDSEKEEEEEEAEEDINSKHEELNGKYLRLYAEFENFRKRTAKESIQMILTANSSLIEKLIPTIENFELAFSPEKKASKLEDFEKGMKMIFNTFKDALEEAGLEEINPEGEEFDPEYHEAMLQQHHDKVDDGHVIQVYQKGYKLKTKIIKHAKVIISKGKEPKKKKK